MPFVIDASVSLAWAFVEERNAYTRGIQMRLETDVAYAPSIWPLEVANVLLIAERRGRITQRDATQFAGMLLVAPISVIETTPRQALNDVLSLARRSALTVYDSSYLELALRLALPIATLDDRLRAAATALGVPILQPISETTDR
ncbi:MAG TPA: type II toxin-antitoxin system VapC family toxin [Armatimonadota bacterium]|jgi:predicted nucleic acid-binding protein